MKNSLYIFIISIFIFSSATAENLNIQSKTISIDKDTKLALFKDEVVAIDSKNNTLTTEFAEYSKDLKVLKSKGETKIVTSEGFNVSGTNIVFDNLNKIIRSEEPAVIEDLDKNEIFLDKFEYSTTNKFFKSTGKIKFLDRNNNSYNFSQIYIDEKKREILGTDIKAFLNQKSLKINKGNKPRVFANTVKIDEKKTEFTKSIFTLCDYRKNDKCPPWTLQAKNMRHDKVSKTIYYKNAVIKFFNLPIFYTPLLSHPDPSVNRRSGFLPPSFSDTKNLGSSIKVPYYWAINEDKDLTLTTKLYTSEHPLYLGEYRQVFEKSNLIFDFGFTEGYKKTKEKKVAGNKSHFFSKFIKTFDGKKNSVNNLELTLQELSNDKYLKLYKVKSSLIESEIDTLENSLKFTHENDNLFLGFEASAYETLKNNYNDKYEYILPDVILDKNLLSSDKYGNFDLTSNLKVHNYDTNKFTKFLINDFDWKFKDVNFSNGLNGKLMAKLKNVNYETQNVSSYKTDQTSEIFGALGYLLDLDLKKETNNLASHLLTPKVFFRYSPDHMRKNESTTRLNHLNLFNIDRLDAYNNFEGGVSTTLGFDYKLKHSSDRNFKLSAGQVINQKNNKKMPSSSSLDTKLSDFVGNSTFNITNKINLNYNFALDQNYKDLNYNELGASFVSNQFKFDFNYLEEKEHIGNQEYLKTSLEIGKGNNGIFKAGTKRNLITNSAEYYNLSYEYLNDCLRAGLVYRREFYNDSELEPEDSLMFKVTLTPFGNISSPSFR